jgi:hypothetical protein
MQKGDSWRDRIRVTPEAVTLSRSRHRDSQERKFQVSRLISIDDVYRDTIRAYGLQDVYKLK